MIDSGLHKEVQQDFNFIDKSPLGYSLSDTINFSGVDARPTGKGGYVFASGIPHPHNLPSPIDVTKLRNTNVFTVNFSQDITLTGSQDQPIPISSPIDFTLDVDGYEPPVGDDQLVFSGGFQSSVFGEQAGLYNYHAFAYPVAIPSKVSFGTASLKVMREYLHPSGFNALTIDYPAIRNRNRNIGAIGIAATPAYGKPYVFNLLQFVRAFGFNTTKYGSAFWWGGVKTVYQRGWLSTATGGIKLTNTTANQGVSVTGINHSFVPAPIVSPHIIYPDGIYSTAFGGIKIIPTPLLKTYGYDQSLHGNTTVWFHTRSLSDSGTLAGIDSYQSGYPSVFDPTREIQARSIIESAIFGDIRARNSYRFVDIPAIDDGSFSDYTAVTNQNRRLDPKGFEPLLFGGNSITNKTPSLWFKGIEPPLASLPSIGAFIRYVAPSGFDRLLLGQPDVIKTPEFKIQGFYATSITPPVIYNYTRYLQPKGFDTAAIGSHRAWFRYRYIKPNGFEWSLVNKPTLTHGVREVISSGFMQDAYGRQAWVSHGTRKVEPRSIFKEFSSNHMLGGHRTLYASSFIATEFGTRIIPESTSIYTQGFIAGVTGLAQTEFKTRYVEPAGYHIIGQSFLDRWGKPDVYNQVQHISLYHQGDSGLVPPRWSDWQSIENRNKVVGVIGFSTIRFGYSQIDNNAAPLLTLGIAPPSAGRDDISMISHAIRFISYDGIEPPLISTWGVVYNAARVAYPDSSIHTGYGQPAVVNTRREYRNIGMIDSLEAGVPMVSFRIRTIDIEPRYSIEPPQINLPTIDLWTKYVDLVGYQTGKYGFPYLDIKFNIIYPKYNHTDKFGHTELRNLTPELFINGHDSSEFGRASLRTQWRNVDVSGYVATLIGLMRISDTKQSVFIRGWLDSAVGQQPEVIKNKTNPYVTQTIWLTNEAGNNKGDGFGFKIDDYGIPRLHQNILMPKSIGQDSKFGNAFLWSSTIKITEGYAYDGVSNNATVINVNKRISVQGIDNTVNVSGMVRLSPNYIVTGNSEPTGYGSSRVGRPKLEFFHRGIYAYSTGVLSKFGMPALDLSIKYLQVAPIRPYSMGFPEIPNFIKDVIVDTGIESTIDFGKTVVKRPPYTGPQGINVRGFVSSYIPRQYVQNFNRSVGAKGSDSLQMGRKKEGDRPFMWQGLRVGPHIPLIIGGDDFVSFGDTTIQLKVRQLTLDGFDSFVSDYDFTNFDKRMRVTGTTTSYVDDVSSNASGFDSLMLGDVGIKLGQHFIRPDGNSDQFRKGGYHA